MLSPLSLSFFFPVSANSQFSSLSLHDALPISARPRLVPRGRPRTAGAQQRSTALDRARRLDRHSAERAAPADRKSTRLNSSHLVISYAVFCLKKKKTRTSLNKNDLLLLIEYIN